MWQTSLTKNNTCKKNSIFYVFFSPIFILFVLLISLIISSSTIYTQKASAEAAKIDSYSVGDKAKSWVYYNALSLCVREQPLNSMVGFDLAKSSGGAMNYMTADQAKSGAWFSNGSGVGGNNFGNTNPAIGYFLSNFQGAGEAQELMGCAGDDIQWIGDAIKLWGYGDGLAILCDKSTGGAMVERFDGSSCSDSVSSPNLKSTSGTKLDLRKFQIIIKNKVYGANEPESDLSKSSIDNNNGIKYSVYYNSMMSGCVGGNTPTTTTSNDDFTYAIKKVDASGELTQVSYAGLKKRSESIKFYIDSGLNTVSKTCEEILKTVNDTAADYAESTANDKSNGIQDKGSTITGVENEPTCGSTVKLVGWIMCPIINGLVLLNDGMWSLTSQLLKTNPLNQNDSIYKAWSAIRSIANVAFAIVFIVIIFSQISNIGITNYGIKKLLPRLIICAILVNISFFIVQIMVDLANITGSSIYSILQDLSSDSGAYTTGGFWQWILKVILSGSIGYGSFVLAGIIGPEVLLWILFTTLIMAALAFFAALFTLGFRTAAIPILAILAPLAFVAYILPNTEQWFKKWKDMFIKMLMLYPLAALVFGGARLASIIIIGDGKNIIYGFIGGIVMALPLFSLPFLAKQGGDILSKVNGALMSLAEKARNPLNQYAKSHKDLAESKHLASGPRPGTRFGFAQRSGHRIRRNMAMRKMTRETDTDTNNENFRSDWARNPHLNEDGTKRTPTDEETKNEKRNGAGYQAIARSLESKDLAESRKTSSQTSYLRSVNGVTAQNNLAGVKAINEKAVQDTQYRVNRIHKDQLKKVDTAKLRNKDQEMDRQVEVNDSNKGRGYNENILHSEQKLKRISGEVEEKFAGSVAGKKLSDDIYGSQQRLKVLSGESAVRVDSTDEGKAVNDSINTTQLRAKELAGESEERVWTSDEGKSLHDSIGLTSEKIKSHSLASETRIAESDEGKTIKEEILGIQDNLKAAQDTIATNYEKNPATLASRLAAHAAGKVLENAKAKTAKDFAEMKIRKKGTDGKDIYTLDANGNPIYEYAFTPDATGMQVPPGFADEDEYIRAVADTLYDTNDSHRVNTAAEKAANDLADSRFNERVAKDENLARDMASVHGENQDGANIRQAVAIEANNRAYRDAVNAVVVRNNAAKYANNQYRDMVTTGKRLIDDPNNPGKWIPGDEDLSPVEFEAAIQSTIGSKFEPIQRAAWDAVNIAPDGETDAQREERAKRQQIVAAEIRKLPKKPIWAGNSALDRMSAGHAGHNDDGENIFDDSHAGMVIDAAVKKKTSPELFGRASDDDMQGMSIAFDERPLSKAKPADAIEQYEARIYTIEQIKNTYKNAEIMKDVSGQQTAEYDRLLNQLSAECRKYKKDHNELNLKEIPDLMIEDARTPGVIKDHDFNGQEPWPRPKPLYDEVTETYRQF